VGCKTLTQLINQSINQSSSLIQAYPVHYIKNDDIHKPDMNNISHWHPRTEPRPQLTRTENLVKFGRVVFVIYKRTYRQTNRHTDRHADHNTSHLYRRRSNNHPIESGRENYVHVTLRGVWCRCGGWCRWRSGRWSSASAFTSASISTSIINLLLLDFRVHSTCSRHRR